jgi:hypothetical protein
MGDLAFHSCNNPIVVLISSYLIPNLSQKIGYKVVQKTQGFSFKAKNLRGKLRARKWIETAF